MDLIDRTEGVRPLRNGWRDGWNRLLRSDPLCVLSMASVRGTAGQCCALSAPN